MQSKATGAVEARMLELPDDLAQLLDDGQKALEAEGEPRIKAAAEVEKIVTLIVLGHVPPVSESLWLQQAREQLPRLSPEQIRALPLFGPPPAGAAVDGCVVVVRAGDEVGSLVVEFTPAQRSAFAFARRRLAELGASYSDAWFAAAGLVAAATCGQHAPEGADRFVWQCIRRDFPEWTHKRIATAPAPTTEQVRRYLFAAGSKP